MLAEVRRGLEAAAACQFVDGVGAGVYTVHPVLFGPCVRGEFHRRRGSILLHFGMLDPATTRICLP